ncbi:MAG: hypothetical protein H0U98_10640 [Alphaproteobacteria bacterium]|nr:hypothetical protein [Alphaproteobacteria bacterium]
MMVTAMQRDHGHDPGQPNGDHAIGGLGRQLMLHDQRGKTGQDQQHGETANAMPAVMAHVMVMKVVAPVTVPSMAGLIAPFVEREFLAHADINFAHMSPCCCAAKTGRKENIIMQSSKVNHMVVSQFEF